MPNNTIIVYPSKSAQMTDEFLLEYGFEVGVGVLACLIGLIAYVKVSEYISKKKGEAFRAKRKEMLRKARESQEGEV